MKAIKSIIRGAKVIAKWGGIIAALLAAIKTLEEELSKLNVSEDEQR